MDYTEIDVNIEVNAVCFGILCNFTPVCGKERAKEAADLVHEIYEERKSLMTRVEAAEARAEKAENERDAAIKDMNGICFLCANAKPYSVLSQMMMTCEYKEVVASTKSLDCKHFKWRGQKEE